MRLSLNVLCSLHKGEKYKRKLLKRLEWLAGRLQLISCQSDLAPHSMIFSEDETQDSVTCISISYVNEKAQSSLWSPTLTYQPLNFFLLKKKEKGTLQFPFYWGVTLPMWHREELRQGGRCPETLAGDLLSQGHLPLSLSYWELLKQRM